MAESPGGSVKKTDTVLRILTAAVKIVNTGGTDALTTRMVAETAGVNTAAVNYHFGTRANLLREVLDLTLSHLFDDWDMILGEQLPLPEKLFYFLDYMMEGIIRYPGLSRAYMFDPALKGFARETFIRRLEGVIDTLSTGQPMKLALTHAVSAVLASAVLPELFSLAGGDMSSETDRRAYLLPLVNGIPGIRLEVSQAFIQRMESLRERAFKE
jgi:AcrR family transcriptional regulator